MRFLILRFSSIGDIVLTSPVIRCLKQQVPGAEVHFLTRHAFLPVVQHNPYIDSVHLFEKDVVSALPDLKKEKFDVIIDLHHNLRSALVKRTLGVKSHSFHKLNFEKWLLVNFKINRLPHKHIVHRYMETVSAYGVVYDGKGLDYFISEQDRQAVSVLPESCKNGYTAFVIGAKHVTKRLRDEKIIAVCKKLPGPVVLLGGPEDLSRGEGIAAAAGSNTLNMCGRLTLNGSAALLKEASRVITHDTGLMHVAAAFQKPIVSVWGNTVTEFGMTPFYDDDHGGFEEGFRTVREVKGLPCRPCSKIGFEKCPRKHFRCMEAIPIEEIVRSV